MRYYAWDFWPREGVIPSRSDRLPLLALWVITEALHALGGLAAWWLGGKDGPGPPIMTSF